MSQTVLNDYDEYLANLIHALHNRKTTLIEAWEIVVARFDCTDHQAARLAVAVGINWEES